MIWDWFQKKIKTKNSRRFKRVHLSYLVKYQVNGKGEPRITNVRDFSAGGLRFWTKERPPENSLLNLRVYLPPLNRFVEAWAKVLRIRRSKGSFVYSVAVSFLDIRQEDRDAINTFAEDLSKEQDARLLIDHADVVVRQK